MARGVARDVHEDVIRQREAAEAERDRALKALRRTRDLLDRAGQEPRLVTVQQQHISDLTLRKELLDLAVEHISGGYGPNDNDPVALAKEFYAWVIELTEPVNRPEPKHVKAEVDEPTQQVDEPVALEAHDDGA